MTGSGQPWLSMLTLSAIFVYPIKSCAGITLDEALVERRGLHLDRRWMLVDAANRFITQRDYPQMARIHPAIAGEGLTVRAAGMEPLSIPDLDSPHRELVTVWRDTVEAAVANDAVNDWFSRTLGMNVRLVAMPPATIRPVDPSYATGNDEVRFQDGFPLLLATESSLADLNRRLAEPVTMLRFRPNVVIAGDLQPFEEDTWSEINVGGIPCHVVKPSARCVIVNVDPATGRPTNKEPLRTLASYRSVNNKPLFAQNLIPAVTGTIRVGDEVSVLNKK